ncbi:hypothetical protein DEU34_2279 [Microbacterium sp. AG1240]|uniref:phage tail tube protein n=1 Tax=Microbacterium sp. AG1240 TaxID=2183992 RepID=UPI000F14A46C|nr:hypothetical protein [Microbacterium sp. AG1240]RKT33675.1 hypothetical protein DEU34_2279 [Microbacterium sp. AG1240]
MPENVQPGFAADGRGTVLWAETLAVPSAPTAAEIADATPLTYGLTADGFMHDTTIATITTGRYTLAQALELDGTVTDTVEVRWVYNRVTPTDVETTLGTPGTDGYLIHSLGYPNGHTFVAGDVLNAVIPVTTSIPRDVPPAQNSEAVKIQKLNVRGQVHREVEVAAGA